MSSNSPISKTSPMIIRLFSTSPIKQGTAAINTTTDSAQSIPECLPADTSRHGLKRKQTDKSGIININTDVKSNKNAKYPSDVEKNSDSTGSKEMLQRKIADMSSKLDFNLETSASSEFKSYIKQGKKLLKCPVAQTKELDIPTLNSVTKPLSNKPSTVVGTKIDSSSNVSECPLLTTCRRGLKRQQNEKSEIINVAHVKSSKNTVCPKFVEKSSVKCGKNEVGLRKDSGTALQLDSNLETSDAPDFKSRVKQRKKNPSCPVAQTKKLDISVLHSVTKPVSKQSTILYSNAEKGKLVSTSVAKASEAEFSCESSEFKSKLMKSPSKKRNKKTSTELPTVNIHEAVASSSLRCNKISIVVDKGDQQKVMCNVKPTKVTQQCIQPLPLEEHSTNLSSEIAVDIKDGINTKLTTVEVDEIPLKCEDRNVSNSSNVSYSIPLMESIKEEPNECLDPSISQLSPASLKVDEPILPIISCKKLSQGDIDRNIISLSNIKVEKNSDELNEIELNKKGNLKISKKEETVQVFKKESSDHETEASKVIVESFSLDQQPCQITQEVDLCGEIHRKELPYEISAETIHEIEVSTDVEDSKETLASQWFAHTSSENIETMEFSSSHTFNRISNKNLDTKLDGSFVLHEEVNVNTQSPKEKSKYDNLENNKNVSKDVLSKHLLQIVSPPSVSKTIYNNEFEDFENCQEELSRQVSYVDSLKTPFSFERNLDVGNPAETDKFKIRGNAVENKIKKRQYRTHASSSPDPVTVEQKKDAELVENSEDPIAVELPDLSWNDQVITEDDVSDLEITELEKIRELLRQQLSQDNEDSSDTLDSTNGIEPIKVKVPQMLTSIQSELGEKHSLPTSVLEKGCMSSGTTEKSCATPDGELDINSGLVSKECPITASASKKNEPSPKKGYSTNGGTSKQSEPIEKQVPETLEKADLSNVMRKHNLEKDKSSSKNKHNDQVPNEAEQVPVTDKPPLVMQSSNLLFNYGLDNRHGGGGSETTDLDVDELRPRKKLKLASADDDFENVDNCDPQQSSQDFQTLDDQLSRDEQPLIQCEDSSSNPGLDDQDSDQNGLMEFDILDEFESDGNDPDENSDTDTSSDDGFDLDEIDAMLDEQLQERMQNNKNKLGANDTEHEEKEKIVLKARGRNHFDVLPEGWIEVTHNSGMPIYLHKMSRVCSMSKPYFLGPGSTRKHQIPVSAIPCLHYLKEKEKEKLNRDTVGNPQNTANNVVDTSSTNGAVGTSNTNGAVDTSITNGAIDTTITNGAVDTSVTNGALDTLTTNGEVGTPTTNGEVDTPTTNGEVDTPTTNDEVDTPTTNGEVVTSSTNGAVDTPTTNGEMDTPTTNGELNTPTTPCDNATEEMSNSDNAPLNSVSSIFPSANLESAKDTKESGSLDCLAVREYCSKRFDFTRITVKRFRTWSGRRKHIRQQKHSQRPFLPDNTKLITCPLYGQLEKTTATGVPLPKREFIMNPSGKSPVCILHEYVQHTLRLQPKYVFKELENASTPYGAVVVINGIEYGCGFGSSKKSAKSDAARSALEILIPKMKILTKEDKEEQDVEFFDQVRIEDPRICDLSVKAGQPYPYQILLECIKRNYGMGETTISVTMTNIKHQKNEFHMTCGKHKASVVCKNKRDGKHRASQAILQKLHPHINSWGSLLRMYGKGSCKTMKEKKEEEQQITELQSKATANKPNMSILCKLKDEMLKYREKVKSKKPIGKLIPESMEFPSSSSSNLKNVEL